LDLKAKVAIAGSIVVRTRVFFDGWWLSAGAEGRAAHQPFWDFYWHYWRYNEHALLVSYIIHTASLFEKKSDTINLGQLWLDLRERADEVVQANIDGLFLEAHPTAKGVTILRSSVMAHRSAKLNYNDAFKKAGLRPDAMRRLTQIALDIVNSMQSVLGSTEFHFDEHALGDLQAITLLHQETFK
jgi:hypothetical protein